MFLRAHGRSKDGKRHRYWSLVETIRTPDGPRQRTLCYLGELNDSAHARWLKTIEVFNEHGEAQQLKLFPSEVKPPANDRDVAQVVLQKVRLERTRQLGHAIWAGSYSGDCSWMSSLPAPSTLTERMWPGRVRPQS